MSSVEAQAAAKAVADDMKVAKSTSELSGVAGAVGGTTLSATSRQNSTESKNAEAKDPAGDVEDDEFSDDSEELNEDERLHRQRTDKSRAFKLTVMDNSSEDRTIHLYVKPSTTMQEICEMIKEKRGIPVDQIALSNYYDNKPVSKDKSMTMKQLKLTKTSTLLMQRMMSEMQENSARGMYNKSGQNLTGSERTYDFRGGHLAKDVRILKRGSQEEKAYVLAEAEASQNIGAVGGNDEMMMMMMGAGMDPSMFAEVGFEEHGAAGGMDPAELEKQQKADRARRGFAVEETKEEEKEEEEESDKDEANERDNFANAEWVVEKDGSSSLVLNKSLYLATKFDLDAEGITSFPDWSIHMDIYLESLPEKDKTLAILSTGFPDKTQDDDIVFIDHKGGVGNMGIFGNPEIDDDARHVIKEKEWTRVTVTLGGLFTNRRLCTYVNGMPCAIINTPALQGKDNKFCLKPGGLLFFSSNEEDKQLTNNVRIRFISVKLSELTPKVVEAAKHENVIFSLWKKRDEDENKALTSKYSLGGIVPEVTPVWRDGSFIGLFCDPFIEGTSLEGGFITPTMIVMEHALKRTVTHQDWWLKGLTDTDRAAVQDILGIFKTSVTLGKELDTCMRQASAISGYLRDLRKKIVDLKPGGSILLGAGWRSLAGGHAITLIVERDGEDEYRLVVCNTGQGVNYHPSTPASSPKWKYKSAIGVLNISQQRIADEAWWLHAYSIYIRGGDHGPKNFYETILPALSQRSLETTFAESMEKPEFEWRSPQRSGTCYFRCVYEALHYMLKRRGVSTHAVKLFKFALRFEMLMMARSDLDVVKTIVDSDRRVLRIACQQLSYAAVKESKRMSLSTEHLVRVKLLVDRIMTKVQGIPCEDDNSIQPPPLLNLTENAKEHTWDLHPLFERFVRDTSVEGLAGPAKPDQQFIPIDFLQIPKRCRTLDEVIETLHRADNLLILMTTQAENIKCTKLQTISFIMQLFTEVIPLPVVGDPGCIYTGIATRISYADQLAILVVLQRISEFLSAATYSNFTNRAFHASRILVFACIATVADAIIRMHPYDTLSVITKHLRGGSNTNHGPYGLDVHVFSKQIMTTLLLTPAQFVARARVLDYFASLHIDSQNHIFSWEYMDNNEVEESMDDFMELVATDLAFPIHTVSAYMPSTGAPDPRTSSHYIVRQYPEFAALRAITFHFKYSMVTKQSHLPNVCDFNVTDAMFTFNYDELEKLIRIYGFSRQLCAISASVGSLFPSGADPSILASPDSISNELDVLHIPTLPAFADDDGSFSVALGQRDSEMLLSYLTVPYIRIPLVLSFFATEDRIHALQSRQLQNVLESVLFEPGAFQKSADAPKNLDGPAGRSWLVPTASKTLLATPYGYLINELVYSPEGTINSIVSLLSEALALDAGSATSSTVNLVLFIIRLASRVVSHLVFLLQSVRGDHNLLNTGIQKIDITPKNVLILRRGVLRLRKLLLGPMLNQLDIWIKEMETSVKAKATEADKMGEAVELLARLHAHMVLVHRNFVDVGLINESVATVLLSSFLFLTTRYTWKQPKPMNRHYGYQQNEDYSTVEAKWPLLMHDLEVFEVLQHVRRPLVYFMKHASPTVANRVLDATVRVTTGTGSRVLNDLEAMTAISNDWGYVGTRRNAGRFTVLTQSGKGPTTVKAINNTKATQVEIEVKEEEEKKVDISTDRPPLSSSSKAANNQLTNTSTPLDGDEDDALPVSLEEDDDPLAMAERARQADKKRRALLRKQAKERQKQLDERREKGGEWLKPCEDLTGTDEYTPLRLPAATNEDRGVEINVQLIQLSLRACHLRALPGEFVDIVSEVLGSTSMQVATVSSNKHREVIQLVGHDHMIAKWDEDQSACPQTNFRPYRSSTLADTEVWLIPLIEPIISDPRMEFDAFRKCSLTLPTDYLTADTTVARLELVSAQMGVIKEVYVFRELRCVTVFDVYSLGRRFIRSCIYSTNNHLTLLDLDQVDPGEQWKSWERHAVGDIAEHSGQGDSIVVTRGPKIPHNFSGGVEKLIPEEGLHGIIPAALLDRYTFWQDTKDNLRGYPKKTTTPDYYIYVELVKDANLSGFGDSKCVGARIIRKAMTSAQRQVYSAEAELEASAERKKRAQERAARKLRRRRAAENAGEDGANVGDVDDDDDDEDDSKAEKKNELENKTVEEDMTLVNILYAPEHNALHSLLRVMTRVERVSNVLVWTKSKLEKGKLPHIDLIELPRLNLSFTLRKDKTNVPRLFSVDHPHLYVSNVRNDLVNNLMRGVPHGLLLTTENDQHNLLVPAVAALRPHFPSTPFGTELILRYNENIFKEEPLPKTALRRGRRVGVILPSAPTPSSVKKKQQKKDAQVYIYPIHVSSSFLFTPTLASAIYMLWLRLAHRLYDEVVGLVNAIATDTKLVGHERIWFDMLKQLNKDAHPDAHACRLKISLVTMDSPIRQPWSVTGEYHNYLNKIEHVSAQCRLNLEQELQVANHIMKCPPLPSITKVEGTVCVRHVNTKVYLGLSERSHYLGADAGTADYKALHGGALFNVEVLREGDTTNNPVIAFRSSDHIVTVDDTTPSNPYERVEVLKFPFMESNEIPENARLQAILVKRDEKTGYPIYQFQTTGSKPMYLCFTMQQQQQRRRGKAPNRRRSYGMNGGKYELVQASSKKCHFLVLPRAFAEKQGQVVKTRYNYLLAAKNGESAAKVVYDPSPTCELPSEDELPEDDSDDDDDEEEEEGAGAKADKDGAVGAGGDDEAEEGGVPKGMGSFGGFGGFGGFGDMAGMGEDGSRKKKKKGGKGKKGKKARVKPQFTTDVYAFMGQMGEEVIAGGGDGMEDEETERLRREMMRVETGDDADVEGDEDEDEDGEVDEELKDELEMGDEAGQGVGAGEVDAPLEGTEEGGDSKPNGKEDATAKAEKKSADKKGDEKEKEKKKLSKKEIEAMMREKTKYYSKFPKPSWPSISDRTIMNASVADIRELSLFFSSQQFQAQPTAILEQLSNFRSNPESIYGTNYYLGFMSLYQMFTGSLRVSISDNTSDSYAIATAYTLMLNDINEQGILQSVLRILMANPHLCATAPKYVEMRSYASNNILKGTPAPGDSKSPLFELLRKFQTFIRAEDKKGTVFWPDTAAHAQKKWAKFIETVPVAKQITALSSSSSQYLEGKRSFILPELSDFGCSRRVLKTPSTWTVPTRQLGPDELKSSVNPTTKAFELGSSSTAFTDAEHIALLRYPLGDSIPLDSFVIALTRDQLNLPPPLDKLPFDVSQHPQANSQVAQQMLARLQDDVQVYAKQAKAEKTMRIINMLDADVRAMVYDTSATGMAAITKARDTLGRLEYALSAVKALDENFVSSGIPYILSILNDVALPVRLDSTTEDVAKVQRLYKEKFEKAQQDAMANKAPRMSKDDRAKLTAEREAAVNEVDIKVATAISTSPESVARYSFVLQRFSGQESHLTLPYIISTLLSSKGDFDLSKINPFLGPEEIEHATHVVEAVLLRANRVGHINRTIAEIKTLQKRLTDLASLDSKVVRGQALYTGIMQKSEQLAAEVTAGRHYIHTDGTYDPRYLVFEFLWNIILRKKQVEMIDDFMSTAALDPTTPVAQAARKAVAEAINAETEESKALVSSSSSSSGASRPKSTVKQLIMGMGKTTVIGPLLALMLADGQRIVAEVVPPALLDSARDILRATFSSVIAKRVYTFSCDRSTTVTESLFDKLDIAIRTRSVVVTTPTAIKALMLKMIELQHFIDDKDSKGRSDQMETESVIIAKILRLFRKGALIMDEVDLILHPLKSELNFPIGARVDLDFQPDRWQLAIHLIDALFYTERGTMAVGFKQSARALQVLARLTEVVQNGYHTRALLSKPHIVLLNPQFYHSKIKPVMANWVLLYLEQASMPLLTRREALTYLCKGAPNGTPLANKVALLPERYRKLLNLGRDWLASFLPHIMQKIDRVTFGLLTPQDIERALAEDPHMPSTRAKLAVPFIGKDVPSKSSEYAHPDITIGLTVLAYRYEGLRWSDFHEIITDIRSNLAKEMGPYDERPSTLLYAEWVKEAGGQIRGKAGATLDIGLTPEEEAVLLLKATDQEIPSDYMTGSSSSTSLSSSSSSSSAPPSAPSVAANSFFSLPPETKTLTTTLPTPNVAGAVVASSATSPSSADSDIQYVVPLRMLKPSNEDQMTALYELLRFLPELIHKYLCDTIFPAHMRHQVIKLSASGQEVGGDALFNQRFGFSGTPSDLLPIELGRCQYEQGADGLVLATMTNPSVVSYELLPDNWTAKSLLRTIATDNRYHALIDTGALITGLTNKQVAEYLLAKGLKGFEGVVFLDELDRKVVLVRESGNVVPLAQCGIPLEKRFTFFDQVHTTGMDVPQPLDAIAVQTLGKDMTFRDYAQGAYRMRGIGKGQNIHLYMIPEVKELINRQVLAAHAGLLEKETVLAGKPASGSDGSTPPLTAAPSDTSLVPSLDGEGPTTPPPFLTRASSLKRAVSVERVDHITSLFAPDTDKVLLNVAAWLTINSMQAERVQFNQLCMQNLSNIWRKHAFSALLEGVDRFRVSLDEQAQDLRDALVVFRESIDFSIAADIPVPVDFATLVSQQIEEHKTWLRDNLDIETANNVLRTVQQLVQTTLASQRELEMRRGDSAVDATVPIRTDIAMTRLPSLGRNPSLARVASLNRTPSTGSPGLVRAPSLIRASSTQEVTTDDVLNDIEEIELGDDESAGALADHRYQAQKLNVEMVQARVQEKEMQIDVTQEQEIEIEKYVDAAYARDNERPEQWPLETLAKQSTEGEVPWAQFYPVSQLALPGRAGLNMPSYILVSKNYFNPKWSGDRRLPNICVVLEAAPEGTAISPLRLPENLTASQEADLITALGLLDGDRDGFVTVSEINELIKACFGLSMHESAILSALQEASGKTVSSQDKIAPSDVVTMIKSGLVRKLQNGRYWIAVTLAEAETIRRVMHLRQELPLIKNKNVLVALRNVSESFAIIDSTGNYHDAPLPTPDQQSTVLQTLRFVNSDMHYTEEDLSVLLHAIQSNSPLARRVYFQNMIGCRRRAARRVQQTPLAQVIAADHVYSFAKIRSKAVAIREAIRARALQIYDAFQLFDTDRNGLLSPAELYGAFEWLGLKETARGVLELVLLGDHDGDRQLTLQEFVNLLRDSDDDDADDGEEKDEPQASPVKQVSDDEKIEPKGKEEFKVLLEELAEKEKEDEALEKNRAMEKELAAELAKTQAQIEDILLGIQNPEVNKKEGVLSVTFTLTALPRGVEYYGDTKGYSVRDNALIDAAKTLAVEKKESAAPEPSPVPQTSSTVEGSEEEQKVVHVVKAKKHPCSLPLPAAPDLWVDVPRVPAKATKEEQERLVQLATLSADHANKLLAASVSSSSSAPSLTPAPSDASVASTTSTTSEPGVEAKNTSSSSSSPSSTAEADIKLLDEALALYPVETVKNLMERDRFVRVPAKTYITVPVPLAANGGGRTINIYTMSVVMRLTQMPKFRRAIIQTNKQNSDPAEVYVDSEGLITLHQDYSDFKDPTRHRGATAAGGADSPGMTVGKWHVVTLRVDAVDGSIDLFLDGTHVAGLTKGPITIDSRLSISRAFALFGSSLRSEMTETVDIKQVHFVTRCIDEMELLELVPKLVPKESFWTCGTCMSINDNDADKCHSCGAAAAVKVKKAVFKPFTCRYCSALCDNPIKNKTGLCTRCNNVNNQYCQECHTSVSIFDTTCSNCGSTEMYS